MKRHILTVAVTATFLLPAQPSYASADCAIWLCLPVGFVGSYCSDARKAFIKRITRFQLPLPMITSCMVTPDIPVPHNDSNVGSADGVAAYVPPLKQCDDDYGCKKEMTPSYIYKDTECIRVGDDDPGRPRDCERTINYVDVYIDGKVYGDTYYFDNFGNQMTADIYK